MKLALNDEIILASKSPSRAALLSAAGFENLRIIPSGVDEEEIKKKFPKDFETCAIKLAAAKALKVSAEHRQNWIIGADQILVFENQIFDKSKNLGQARELLKSLRGCTHQLIGGQVIARDQKILWQSISRVELTMRDFSDEYLEAYIQAMDEKLLASVGAYQLEGPAIHLFSQVKGDYFAVLGLDLLPLLQALRTQNAILS